MTSIVSPFFGGGSFEIACAAKGLTVYGYDLFKPLVCFWQALLETPQLLANVIERFHPLPDERFYEMQKEILSPDLVPLQIGARFFVLNRCSFSGTTLSGGRSPGFPRFNDASIQRVRDFRNDNIRWVRHLGFEESIRLHPNDYVFADPPYMIENSLYGNRGDCHEIKHENLRDILHGRERWMLCYNDCEQIRDWYSDYEILTPSWAYGMSKKRSEEVLILDHWTSRQLAKQRIAGKGSLEQVWKAHHREVLRVWWGLA